MADETMQPAPADAAEALAPAPAAGPAMRVFICATRVLHGAGTELPRQYEPGDRIELAPERDAHAIAELRRVGAIKLPEELMDADELAARQRALADENARLQAELEALRAAQAEAARPAPKAAGKKAEA